MANHRQPTKDELDAAARRDLGDTHRPGAIAAVGPAADDRRDPRTDAMHKACREHGEQTVLRALRVDDTDLLEFAGWFHDVERQAEADREAVGGPSHGAGGTGDGVMLTRAMLLSAQVPILLRRIMDDPVAIWEELG